MKTAGQRILGLLTALLVTMGAFAPTKVAADVGIQPTLPAITDGTTSNTPTTVGFAGSQWVVIGYNGNGVHSETGTMTLLLASGYSLGTSAFNSNWQDGNGYGGSTLQGTIDGIVSGIGAGEQRLIQPRTLEGGSGNYYDNDYDSNKIKGATVDNAMLWPLSEGEANQLNSNTMRVYSNGSYNTDWWLRSPGNYDDYAALVLSNGAVVSVSSVYHVLDALAVRPALTINLESVLFTSSADAGSGKSTVGIADGLVGAAAPGTNLKFTVLDENMATPVVTLVESSEGTSTLQFSFTGAEAGGNQFVSAVVTASSSDDVLYYTKLADCDTNPDGTFSVDVSSDADGNPLPDGSYTLRVFSEQANGDNFTDFASKPYDIPFTVASGTAEVDVATPNIDTNPTGATYTEGDTSADLTVAASTTDSGVLSYQWYSNTTNSTTGGAPITDADSDSYTPPTDTVGTLYYYCVVTNTLAGKPASTPSATAQVNVLALVDAETPSITTQPQDESYTEGDTPADLAVIANVSDGGTLSYQWFGADDTTGTNEQELTSETGSSFTPPTDTAGTFYYFVRVTNTNTLPAITGQQTATTDSNVATITVTPAPTLTLDAIAAPIATEGVSYSFTPGYSYNHASDTLEFALTGDALPTGLTFSTTTGEISGSPATGSAKTYNLTLTVKEQTGSLSDSQNFTLTVQAATVADTLALTQPGNDAATVGTAYQRQLSASYTGTNTLEYSATNLPAGVGIDAATGLISGTPTKAGTYPVTAAVAEQNGTLRDSKDFTITVVAAPKDPEPEKPDLSLGVLPANNTVRVGDSFTLKPSEDGQTGETGWTYDSAYFTATFNSPATFTAIKEGSSTITYTAPDGRTVSATITIQAASETTKPTTSTPSSTPKDSAIAGTGDSSTVWLYAVLATIAAAFAGGLVWYKRRKASGK